MKPPHILRESDAVRVEDPASTRADHNLECVAIAPSEIGIDSTIAIEDAHPSETLGDDIRAFAATHAIGVAIVVIVVVGFVPIWLRVPEASEIEAEVAVSMIPALMVMGVI